MASNQRIRPFPLTYPDKILYQIVNLKETASQKEIDRAWIGLDPDSYDSEKMLDVVKAFWILRDSYRRRVYDNYGSFLSVISDSRLTNPDIDRTLLMGIANGLDYIKNKCKLNLDPSQQLDFKTLVTS